MSTANDIHEARRPAQPACPEVGVLALVPNRFADPWQVRHQLLTRLAQVFRVVWLEPARGWREAWFARGRKRSAPSAVEPPALLHVDRSGRLYPKLHRPRRLAEGLERQRLRRAAAWLRARGCRRIVLYLWRPEFAPALDYVSYDLACYHIDDEYSFSEVEHEIAPLERHLIERVDRVFIHSPALLEKKGNLNPHTLQVSNGVDFTAFAADRREPEDLRTIPRPRLGYTGVLKPQLDLELLENLARSHPDWSLVLIGPRGHLDRKRAALDAVVRLPHVHELGHRSAHALPAYTRHLDVGLLPYRLNAYTRYIQPLKLQEYLAAGLPVVGSALRSLEDVGEVVRVAHGPEDWSRAIAESLSPAARSEAARRARQDVARRNDWSVKVGQVAGAMAEGLGLSLPEAEIARSVVPEFA